MSPVRTKKPKDVLRFRSHGTVGASKRQSAKPGFSWTQGKYERYDLRAKTGRIMIGADTRVSQSLDSDELEDARQYEADLKAVEEAIKIQGDEPFQPLADVLAELGWK